MQETSYSILSLGIKIPHAAGQLSLGATAEPARTGACALQRRRPDAAKFLKNFNNLKNNKYDESENVSRSVMSDSLRPHKQ